MSEAESEQPAEEPTEPEGTPEEPGEPEPEPEPAEEPEEPEEPEEESTEPAPPVEPAPTSGLTQAEADKIIRDAGTDWARFRDRTIARWQSEGEHLRDCPLCFDSHKGLVDVRDAGQYPRELVNSVMAFLGLARERDYKQSGKHNTCSFCDGEGRVKTGSQVPDFESVACPECNGYGYMPPPTTGTRTAANGAGDAAGVPAPVTDIPQEEIDNWGEPRTLPDGRVNPNFGKQPSFKVLVEPYGITAGLSSRELEEV